MTRYRVPVADPLLDSSKPTTGRQSKASGSSASTDRGEGRGPKGDE